MIRKATHADIDFMLDVGEILHQESCFRRMTWDRKKARKMVESLIDNDQYCVCDERDGKIVGFMGGYVIQPWYSDDFLACDISFYIAPEYRGSGRAAYRMIQAFTQWAKSRCIKQIRPGIATGAIGNAADRLYQKLGYERVGGLYLMEVQNGYSG